MTDFPVLTIIENYLTYSDYEEQGSASRAKSFITWANRLIALPSHVTRNSNGMTYDKQTLAEQIRVARQYVSVTAGAADAGDVAFFSLENFRG